jgi:hypothetical protein
MKFYRGAGPEQAPERAKSTGRFARTGTQWRVRVISRIVGGAILASTCGGCASLSGLDQFAGGNCVDGCDSSLGPSLPTDDGSLANSPDAEAAGPNRPMGSEVSDWSDAGEQGTVGGGKTDASGDDAGDADAGNSGDAAAEGGGCGPQTCSNGCCDEHDNCAVTSASTCGTGGVACLDCARGGQICSQGSCATLDAGKDSGATCAPSTCLNLCVPYFHQCCKADDTCGCSLNFPIGPCE